MDYEQMYINALKRAKDGKPIDEIFPELNESEDERIRKELIHYLEINASQMTPNQDWDFRNKWLPWLEKQAAQTIKEALRTEYEKGRANAIAEFEKQGEQKLVIPKFRVGDKVKNGYLIYTVEDIKEDYYKMTAYGKDGYKGETLFLTIGCEDGYELVEQKPVERSEDEQNLVKIPKFKIGDTIEFNGLGHNKYTIKEVFGTTHYINTDNARMDMSYTDANFELVEQKPTDKIEPKFKVGDWIISDEAHKDYRICKIIEVENGNYKIESIYGYSGYNQYKVFDSIYRLWTIEDAKPGDILAVEPYFDTDEYPFPFVAIYESRGLDFFNSYCFTSFDGIFCKQETTGHDLNKIHPATKEQRDFLFAQMKDAGYEWDVEKKELRKIKQNFSEHEKPLLERFKKAVYNCAWEKVTCKVKGESKEEYADRWAEQLLTLVRDWADDYIDSKEDSIRRRSFDKGKYSMQNHAWSEEDEKIYNRINDLIHAAAYANYDVDEDGKELGEYARITNWFKSIKERMKG